jgi:signal transduction histidine kinase
MLRFVKRQPQWLIMSETLLLLLAVAWSDLRTDYPVTLLYAVPVLFAVAFCERYAPLAIAALASVFWCWGDLVGGHEYFSGGEHAWQISLRCTLFFAVAITGVALKDRQSAIAARWQLLEHSRQLEQQINQITEHEQQRIGRELHDGLSQYLAAVSCAASALKIDIERRGERELLDLASKIEHLLGDAVTQTRDLSRSLAPVGSDEAGLEAALWELAAASSRRFGIVCTCHCAGEMAMALNGSATHLYRIAQEAIDNAVKHGRAQHVDLALSANANAVVLSISDDGAGFSKAATSGSGVGLSVMRYRTSIIGGEFEIEERTKGGTVVSCTVPALQG